MLLLRRPPAGAPQLPPARRNCSAAAHVGTHVGATSPFPQADTRQHPGPVAGVQPRSLFAAGRCTRSPPGRPFFQHPLTAGAAKEGVMGETTYEFAETVFAGDRSGKQTSTIVFLHGLGDTGHGWADNLNSLGECLYTPCVTHTLCLYATLPAPFYLHSRKNNRVARRLVQNQSGLPHRTHAAGAAKHGHEHAGMVRPATHGPRDAHQYRLGGRRQQHATGARHPRARDRRGRAVRQNHRRGLLARRLPRIACRFVLPEGTRRLTCTRTTLSLSVSRRWTPEANVCKIVCF